MTDDFRSLDSHSTGMYNIVNEFGFQGFHENDREPNKVSITNPNGFGSQLSQTPSSSTWTQPSHFGNNGKLGGTQVQVPESIECNGIDLSTEFSGIDPSAFEVASNSVSGYLDFDSQDFTTSNGFNGFMTAPNNEFQQLGSHIGGIDPMSGSTTSGGGASAYFSMQHVDNSKLKKRRISLIQASKETVGGARVFSPCSVLNLIFKYAQDLTTTQIENIADDTGCSPELVFSSYLRYRKAAKFGLVLPNSSPMKKIPPFTSTEGPSDGVLVDSKNCGESEDTATNYNGSKDAGLEEDQHENRSGDLEHGTQCKPFRCLVPECNTRFSRQGELNRHSKKHGPGEFPCTFPSCGKIYYRKDKLRQHWEKEHDNNSRPASLSSSRPRRDPDQDGNSRSKGFSRERDDGTSRPSSDQSSEGGDAKNSGSSDKGRACGGHSLFRTYDSTCELDLDSAESGKTGGRDGHEPTSEELHTASRRGNQLLPPIAEQGKAILEHLQPEGVLKKGIVATRHENIKSPPSGPIKPNSDESDRKLNRNNKHQNAPRDLLYSKDPIYFPHGSDMLKPSLNVDRFLKDLLSFPGSPSSSISSMGSPEFSVLHTKDQLESLERISLDETSAADWPKRQRSLPCLLDEIIVCPATFRPSEREEWYLHSLSHYGYESPPRHAVCIFCPKVFDSTDADKCWRARMNHIADHFENGWTMTNARPDFHVIDDLGNKGCIPEETRKHCLQYSERPRSSTLHAHDFIPEEIKKKQEATYEQVNNIPVPESRREIRDRQRGKKPLVVGLKKPKARATVVD